MDYMIRPPYYGKMTTGRHAARTTLETVSDDVTAATRDDRALVDRKSGISGRKPKRHYTPRERRCKVCGQPFKPKTAAARCCSHACRSKLYRQRHRRKKPQTPYERPLKHSRARAVGWASFHRHERPCIARSVAGRQTGGTVGVQPHAHWLRIWV